MRLGSDEITFHVTTDDSGGGLIAAEVTIPPGGGPPAMHRHPPEELYRGEAGELAIYLEEEDGEVRRIAVTPGVVVHIPGGRPHNVRNESDAEARAFVVFTPGADIERFFRAAAAAPRDIAALAARHGVEFTRALP